MAQIFHPGTNVLARVSIFGALGLPVILILLGSGISRSPYNTSVGIPKEQPVAFSHEHHATELGIDCRYCHTSVEKSAVAGIPPTQTCMSCHSQIWTNSPLLEPVRASYAKEEPLKWNKINSVPDFVYFNHSIHVNRGVSCNICHGPIQKQMITFKGKAFFMAWCLNCHRSPESFVGKREDVFKLYYKYQTYQVVKEEKSGKELSPAAPETLATKALNKVIEEDQLTPEQAAMMEGEEFSRAGKNLEAGEAQVKDFKVKKEQLTDCATCHR